MVWCFGQNQTSAVYHQFIVNHHQRYFLVFTSNMIRTCRLVSVCTAFSDDEAWSESDFFRDTHLSFTFVIQVLVSRLRVDFHCLFITVWPSLLCCAFKNSLQWTVYHKYLSWKKFNFPFLQINHKGQTGRTVSRELLWGEMKNVLRVYMKFKFNTWDWDDVPQSLKWD